MIGVLTNDATNIAVFTDSASVFAALYVVPQISN